MKVVCIRLISPVNGRSMTDSSWVKLDSEYPVLSILAAPGGKVQVQILTEDGIGAGWFDSSMFMTSDATIPSNWVVKINDGGEIEMAPDRWTRPGFWEAFYDGVPAARQAFDEELSIILGPEAFKS